eukprot:3980521-Prymnesium_polylepis.1
MREATPTHSPTARTPEGWDAAITEIARSKLGFTTQGRLRVLHAWQQALSAAECTIAHVGRLHNANPRS